MTIFYRIKKKKNITIKIVNYYMKKIEKIKIGIIKEIIHLIKK